jgi:hypothetical protein
VQLQVRFINVRNIDFKHSGEPQRWLILKLRKGNWVRVECMEMVSKERKVENGAGAKNKQSEIDKKLSSLGLRIKSLS